RQLASCEIAADVVAPGAVAPVLALGQQLAVSLQLAGMNGQLRCVTGAALDENGADCQCRRLQSQSQLVGRSIPGAAQMQLADACRAAGAVQADAWRCVADQLESDVFDFQRQRARPA